MHGFSKVQPLAVHVCRHKSPSREYGVQGWGEGEETKSGEFEGQSYCGNRGREYRTEHVEITAGVVYNAKAPNPLLPVFDGQIRGE